MCWLRKRAQRLDRFRPDAPAKKDCCIARAILWGWLQSFSGLLKQVQVEIFHCAGMASPRSVGRFRMCSVSGERNNMRTNLTTPKTIDEYIAGFPHEVQVILEKLRKAIGKAAPEAEETISYQIPAFTLEGSLVHFAAFKKHIGFYPRTTAIAKFKNELSVYEGAKGTVRFPLDKPIPFALISKIVKFRVKENLERAEAKGKKK